MYQLNAILEDTYLKYQFNWFHVFFFIPCVVCLCVCGGEQRKFCMLFIYFISYYYALFKLIIYCRLLLNRRLWDGMVYDQTVSICIGSLGVCELVSSILLYSFPYFVFNTLLFCGIYTIVLKYDFILLSCFWRYRILFRFINVYRWFPLFLCVCIIIDFRALWIQFSLRWNTWLGFQNVITCLNRHHHH